MTSILQLPLDLASAVFSVAADNPTATFVLLLVALVSFYYSISFLAPFPRSPSHSEKQYITTSQDGGTTTPKLLPCWYDTWAAHRRADQAGRSIEEHTGTIDAAELEMSVVIPAFNEEDRLEIMLEEAVVFLDARYGREAQTTKNDTGEKRAGINKRIGGYEILIVNDGSKDKTVEVALAFSAKNKLHDIIRICTLKENRGKGGAVTHGFRHVRGAYVIFADADGASRFEDLAKLVQGCDAVVDASNRGIAVGSRSHLVGSEAVVKRSILRNALMHSFHIFLRLLTPPATSKIRDTQCGFKLFSRASLPHIIPYMHAEGWIFDVEMLMLAESAPPAIVSKGELTKPGINVAEVHIGWQEVEGSKLNVIADSLGMAWGLTILRLSWLLGVYKRR